MPTKPTGRPRGRPPGSKNKPKTIEALVIETLEAPPPLPPRPQPKRRTNGGPWSNMTPEERSALGKALAAKRKSAAKIPGKPPYITNDQWRVMQEVAASDAKRIIKKMRDAGQLPDDPRAVEALEETVKALRTSTSTKDKIAAARLILDFTKSKPVQKTETTIRTHEDFLDELAGDLDD